MVRKYYDALEINEGANLSEIKSAYKKAAYKWHPDRHPASEKVKAEKKFKEISEAYEVLSDTEKREAYDNYGDDRFSDATNRRGQFNDFVFTDPHDIFRRFFNATAQFSGTSPGAQAGNEHNTSKIPLKDHPKSIILNCTLNELFSGCQKVWKITKRVTDVGGKTISVEKALLINVQPGWKAGTKVTFEGEGDETPDRLPADYIFVIEELPHDVFTRVGDDLLYKHTISLAQALSGFEFQLLHLDGHCLSVVVDEVVSHKKEKVVKGEGMPSKAGRGDLRVRFEVEFPQRLRCPADVAFLRE